MVGDLLTVDRTRYEPRHNPLGLLRYHSNKCWNLDDRNWEGENTINAPS